MVALPPLPRVQTSGGLPAWAFTYELPPAPVGAPDGFGGGGFGGGGGGALPAAPGAGRPAGGAPAPAMPVKATPVKAAPAKAPVRLGDLIPDFKGPSLALGGRLDDFGNVLFTADEGNVEVTGAEGGTRTSSLLDARNRVLLATSFGYVPAADSQGRFEAARALVERTFGKPAWGERKGTETLTLGWVSPDGTARLELESNSASNVWIRTTLARSNGPDRYYAPRPRDEGNGG